MTEATLKVTDAPAPDEKPSEALVRIAIEPQRLDYTGDDGKPHTLDVRKPGILAQFQLIEALGDVASNDRYMQMVQPIIYLGKMDGEAVYPPISKIEIEALIQRLGEEGFGALQMWWLQKVMAPSMEAADAAMKREREKLKN